MSENGFIYLFPRNSEDGLRRYWNCAHVQSGYCKAIVHTINLNDEPIAVKRIGTHNHSGDGAKIEILKAKQAIKERAISTQETTSALVTHATANLSQAAKGQINSLHTLKKMSQRERIKIAACPAAPNSLAMLEFPDAYQSYDTRENTITTRVTSAHQRGENTILKVINQTHKKKLLLKQVKVDPTPNSSRHRQMFLPYFNNNG